MCGKSVHKNFTVR